MKANLAPSDEAIAAYLNRLKGMSESQQQEILVEIRSHLAERVEQFAGQGRLQPGEAAVAAMGDADELARQFARTVSEQKASRSFAPWVLLRAAGGIAFTGVKGLLTFLLGVVGYAGALGFTLTAILKLIIPSRVGFWVGPHMLIWGVPATRAHSFELAGQYFIPVSVAMAFVFASGTTLALRWLTRSKLSLESVLRRRAR
jgi:hypothetical protein